MSREISVPFLSAYNPFHSQKKNNVGIYQNFVMFASICAERLDENEVNRMREVVEALDNKDRVIRPQTFKERPLMYKEYVILARRLIEEYTFVKKKQAAQRHVGQNHP